MKNIVIGVAIGYMFHDVIDHFVKQVTTIVVNESTSEDDNATTPPYTGASTSGMEGGIS